MRTRKMTLVTALAVLGLTAGTALAAATPAQTCQTSKLGVAGKYAFCWLKAEAKALKAGASPDFSKCVDTYSKKWGQAETKATDKGGVCLDAGNEASIKAFVEACDSSVATAVGGGGLILDPVACGTQLATCGTQLATCTDALAASQALPHWTCPSSFYATDDGCDCGCGVVDPDCAGPGSPNCEYCGGPGSCSSGSCPGSIDPENNSTCSLDGWTCDSSYFGDGMCDCGCGRVDSDCADSTVASCDYCNDIGSCQTSDCPGSIDPVNNWRCAP